MSFPWPGRDRLSARERILIESRTFRELVDALGTVTCDGDSDSALGFFEYLLMDWMWLRDPEFREQHPNYFSFHWALLRTSLSYAKAIKWQGRIPATEAVLESWNAVSN